MPNSASPASAAGTAASVPMPSRPAARQTSAGSPPGSAAASSSRRRVSAGSASLRRRKLSSMLLDSAAALGSPNPPASSAAVRPRGQFQQGQRVAPGLGDDLVADPRIQRPGQHRVQQFPRIVRRAARRSPAPAIRPARRSGTRAPNTRPTDSSPRRRATNARTCAEAGRATARRLSGTPAAVPQPHRPAGSARPARSRTGPAPGLRHPERGLQRVTLRHRDMRPDDRAAARTAGAVRRTPVPSRTGHPPRAPAGSPDACPAR